MSISFLIVNYWVDLSGPEWKGTGEVSVTPTNTSTHPLPNGQSHGQRTTKALAYLLNKQIMEYLLFMIAVNVGKLPGITYSPVVPEYHDIHDNTNQPFILS